MEASSLTRGSPGYAVWAGLGEYIPPYDPRNQKFVSVADEFYLIDRFRVSVHVWIS